MIVREADRRPTVTALGVSQAQVVPGPFGAGMPRPRTRRARQWGRLEPVGGRSWLDLASPDAPDGIRMVYALLDGGFLEAWQDDEGHVRLCAPNA